MVTRNTNAPIFPKAAAPGISAEQIARRAYELFVARGRAEGHDLEDWLQAERELSLARRPPGAP